MSFDLLSLTALFFESVALVYLCYLALFLIGAIALQPVISSDLWKTLPKTSFTLLGLFLLTSLYAFCMSKGNTSLIIILVIYLGFLLSYIKQRFLKSPDLGIHYKFIKEIFLKLRKEWKWDLFLIVLAVILLMVSRGPGLGSIHPDFVYYGGLSDYLNLISIENNALDIIREGKDAGFYHYGVEWFNATVSKVTVRSGLWSLLQVTYPLVFFIYLRGIIDWMRVLKVKIGVSLSILIVLTVILFGPFVRSEFLTLSSIIELSTLPIIGKTSTIKLLLVTGVFSVLFQLRHIGLKEMSGLMLIFSIAILAFWPTLMLAVYPSAIIYGIMNFFKGKTSLNKYYILFCFSSLFFMGFYLSNSKIISLGIELPGPSLFDLLLEQYWLSYEGWINFSKFFFGTIIMRLYYFLPLLIILFVLIKLKVVVTKNVPWSALIILVVVASMGKAFLYFMIDSNQIFENVLDNTLYYSIGAPLIILLINHFLYSRSVYGYTGVVALMIFSFLGFKFLYENKRNTYYQQDEISGINVLDENLDSNKRIAIFRKSDNPATKHQSLSVYMPFGLIRWFREDYFPIDLNVHYMRKGLEDITIGRYLRSKANLGSSPYYRFIKANLGGVSEISDLRKEQIELFDAFIDYYSIKYIIVERDSDLEEKLLNASNFSVLTSINSDYLLFSRI